MKISLQSTRLVAFTVAVCMVTVISAGTPLGFVTGMAAYANDEVFVVPRIVVSAQAESAIAAKKQAVESGRRQAMDSLLRRLTPSQEWNYLPRLTTGEPAGAAASIAHLDGRPGKSPIVLDDAALQSLEQSFEVYDEKSSPTTYRAFITYRFKPAETRNLLISSQIPYSEAQTRMALVLPVLETANGLYLWEQNNPWLRAWQTRPLGHELTPMTAPLGDLEDSATLTARNARNLNQEKLAILANRYGVSQVIIAHARLSQSDGGDKLRVQLINGYRESGALGPNDQAFSNEEALNGLADAASDRLNTLNNTNIVTRAIASIGADGTIAGNPGDVLSESWLNAASGNFPRLAEDAIDTSVSKYAAGWKAQTLIDHSISTELQASAFFKSLREWKQIRAALISTPLVGSVQVRNLSREGAEMSIRAFGDPGKLVVAMESQGLSLWTYDQGPIEDVVWNIATPATAAGVPVRVQRAPLQQRRERRRGLFGENDSFYGSDAQNDLPYRKQGEQPVLPTAISPDTDPFVPQAGEVANPYNQ